MDTASSNVYNDARHSSGYRRAYVTRVCRVRLCSFNLLHFQRFVLNGDLARLAVKFEEHGALAFRMRFPHGEILDDQRFAGLDLSGDLFAVLHPVIELRCGQHTDITVELLCLSESKKDLRIH